MFSRYSDRHGPLCSARGAVALDETAPVEPGHTSLSGVAGGELTRVSGSRLLAIDVLRGTAVLAVVIAHLPFSKALAATGPDELGAHAVLTHTQTALMDYGRYGVHLFLVISGFCIHYPWARRAGPARLDMGAFWKRRLRRLYPPYACAVVLSLAGLFFYHSVLAHHTGPQSLADRFGFSSNGQLAFDIATLALLAQNLTSASWHIGNGPLWTLALEEQLYALYLPLVLLRRRFGWGLTFAAILTLTLLSRSVGFGSVDHHGAWFRAGPCRWAEWALGAVAVEAHLGHVRLPRWASSPWTALALSPLLILLVPPSGASLIPAAWLFSDLAFGVFFFVIVNWMCALERTGKLPRTGSLRALGFVGFFSYSVYLTHEFVLVGAKQVAIRVGLGTIGVLATRLFASFGFGYVFFRLIERRFLSSRKVKYTASALFVENRAA